MEKKERLSRRKAIKRTGLATTAALGTISTPWLSPSAAAKPADWREQIPIRVEKTPFVDTHEHLIEEADRISGKNSRIKANDWSMLLSHYIDSDLLTAGMPSDDYNHFFYPNVDPIDKWELIEPFWPSVRLTGYGQAVDIAIRKIYGIDGLAKGNIKKIQNAYLNTIKKGYYHHVLNGIAGIESCQVNYLGGPFKETAMPTLLMQDLSFLGMHIGPNIEAYAPKAGIEVKELDDWHSTIDWWFKTYGPYAVAVKSQAAYGRKLDYDNVPAEKAAPIFKKRLAGENLTAVEKKKLEDHLFWYSVNKAAEYNLPVKLHTGYYAGQNYMPLSRLQTNPASVTDLCRMAPDVQWVFMHICYPYYEELISAAKHYTNAHIDMCWAWIISPVASVNFLKQYLVTAPANKILTFGGDYIPVEPVAGHAAIARHGIVNSLAELVDEGWISLDNALDLVEPIMYGNAHRIFRLQEKTKTLNSVPWL